MATPTIILGNWQTFGLDATYPNTFADSYILVSSRHAGTVADEAEQKESTNFNLFTQSHVYSHCHLAQFV